MEKRNFEAVFSVGGSVRNAMVLGNLSGGEYNNIAGLAFIMRRVPGCLICRGNVTRVGLFPIR